MSVIFLHNFLGGKIFNLDRNFKESSRTGNFLRQVVMKRLCGHVGLILLYEPRRMWGILRVRETASVVRQKFFQVYVEFSWLPANMPMERVRVAIGSTNFNDFLFFKCSPDPLSVLLSFIFAVIEIFWYYNTFTAF